jgi:hypothetical protein
MVLYQFGYRIAGVCFTIVVSLYSSTCRCLLVLLPVA